MHVPVSSWQTHIPWQWHVSLGAFVCAWERVTGSERETASMTVHDCSSSHFTTELSPKPFMQTSLQSPFIHAYTHIHQKPCIPFSKTAAPCTSWLHLYSSDRLALSHINSHKVQESTWIKQTSNQEHISMPFILSLHFASHWSFSVFIYKWWIEINTEAGQNKMQMGFLN